jgi:plastocyanin domain-containing protein
MRVEFMVLALLVACGGAAEAPAEAPAGAPEAAAAAPTAAGTAGAAGSATAALPAKGRKVVVTVSGEGFFPTEIQANPSEKLTLSFDRAEAGNCGEEVVFAATGQRVALPVGRVTDVPVEVPATGEIAFACGMGMYQGKVVVVGG